MQSALETHLDEIGSLIDIPEQMRELALQNLVKLRDAKPPELNPLGERKISNAILSLEKIAHSSIKQAYKIIFNQLCILSVSALSADLENHFSELVDEHPEHINVEKANFQVSFKELADVGYKIESVGELLIKKESSINFQDLQSIIRSYKDYCKKDIQVPGDVKNSVIFYQQCRHVLLHRNGIVDANFVKRTGNANLKELKVGNKIQLDENDWHRIKRDFAIFFDCVTQPNQILAGDIPF